MGSRAVEDGATAAVGGISSENADDTLLLITIERCRWNMTHTARQLGVSRNTLYRRIKLLGIPLLHARRGL
jgi:sigma-54 dependent transcriptional regulator, acetoin dehydrogenase operon transcriptional activator AcoR